MPTGGVTARPTPPSGSKPERCVLEWGRACLPKRRSRIAIGSANHPLGREGIRGRGFQDRDRERGQELLVTRPFARIISVMRPTFFFPLFLPVSQEPHQAYIHAARLRLKAPLLRILSRARIY